MNPASGEEEEGGDRAGGGAGEGDRQGTEVSGGVDDVWSGRRVAEGGAGHGEAAAQHTRQSAVQLRLALRRHLPALQQFLYNSFIL